MKRCGSSAVAQGIGEFYRQLKKRNLWREIEYFGKIWE